MRKPQLPSIFIISAWLMYGCGGGSSTPPPQVATRLLVTAASSTVATGTALSITVSALDNSGGVVGSYAGTVHFASTDTQAVLPADTILSGGTVIVQVTLKSSGKQTVTASDVANKLTAGTSGGITVSGGAPLTITSGNPPDGVAGADYNGHPCPFPGHSDAYCAGFSLQATGGVQPYTWSWTGQPGSSTPPGLSIQSSGDCGSPGSFADWRIVCIPTTAGTYNVVITVADSASPPNQVNANYTVNITNPPPPAISTNPPPSEGAINLPYSFKFTATYGLKPLTWSETGTLPPGLNLANDGALSGTPTSTGSFPITLMVVDSAAQSATPQDFTIDVALHGFKVTGSMFAGREFHTATLLPDGEVFVVGGVISEPGIDGGVDTGLTPTTVAYNPATRTFSSTSSMHLEREKHTATLLNTGKVLVAGGWNGTAYTTSAEIFDPASNTFTPTTGNMTTARGGHQATLLNDGKVLITGGWTNGSPAPALASAEIFDPVSGMFTSTGSMHTERTLHTQTTLKDGTVLVTGGEDNTPSTVGTAEIYDPKSGSFSAPINMTTPRAAHAATLLNSGKVLVTGGGDGANWLASAEIFDPSSSAFAATTGSMGSARNLHTATLLNDGTVLVAGGSNGQTLALTELFDPTSETFMGTGSLVTQRQWHTATLLNDGTVLVTGGAYRKPLGGPPQYTILASAETYQ